MSKFRYKIFPEYIYTLEINGQTFEMLGEEILDAIYLRMDDGK